MSAFKIFSRFAELLDIQTTRAAAAWLRLNANGSVSQRTAAETLADIGVSRCGFAAIGSSQTINAVTWTNVTFSTETEDTNNAWDGNTFTVPAGKGGIWEIAAVFAFTSVTDGGIYVVAAAVNSGAATHLIGRGTSGGTGLAGAGGCVRLALAAGDTVKMVVYSANATSAYSVVPGYCTFSAYRMIG